MTEKTHYLCRVKEVDAHIKAFINNGFGCLKKTKKFISVRENMAAYKSSVIGDFYKNEQTK